MDVVERDAACFELLRRQLHPLGMKAIAPTFLLLSMQLGILATARARALHGVIDPARAES